MENKTKKLTAIAAGAVVLTGAAFAAPSFASAKHHTFKAASSSTAAASTPTTAPTWGGASGDANDDHKGGARFGGSQASIAATVTAVPATVTDAEVAEHGAAFIAYDYTGTAPTTQPTTGGHPVHFEATTLANGTATGTIDLHAPKTAGTYTVAIYSSKTDTTPVLVTIVVDAAGKATATATAALASAFDATIKAPAFGGPEGGPADGKGFGPRGGHGHGPHGDNDGDGPQGGAGWTPSTTATPAPTTGTTTNG